MPDFAAAAGRHYNDASLLQGNSMHANADHLAGFAAECGLKAILVGFLGGTLDAKGKPSALVSGKSVKYNNHLPDLWGQMKIFATGRTASRFAALIGQPNPFVRWNIADRYEDGKAITAARTSDHLTAARDILAILQRARIDGVLP
jgi:hypothetical protein